MESIPLEKNTNWWWYKAKNNLLTHILNTFIKVSNLNILEIGPGLGNNLQTLSKYGKVDVLETDVDFIDYLKNTNQLREDHIFKSLDEVDKKYDLIVMLDVLEHIENSREFMLNLKEILHIDSLAIIGVPAYDSLWSVHDEELLHFRRYNWQLLKEETKHYTILKKYGFNFLLLPVRYLQIKFIKPSSTSSTGSLLNSLMYLVSRLEIIFTKIGLNPKFGISLYVVLKN